MPEDELGVADESGVDIAIPKASVSATVVVSVSRWAADVVREMRSKFQPFHQFEFDGSVQLLLDPFISS
jgi:hypothetical protein